MSGRVSKPSARAGSFDAWDLRDLLASPTEPVQKRSAVGKEGAAELPIVRKP